MPGRRLHQCEVYIANKARTNEGAEREVATIVARIMRILGQANIEATQNVTMLQVHATQYRVRELLRELEDDGTIVVTKRIPKTA